MLLKNNKLFVFVGKTIVELGNEKCNQEILILVMKNLISGQFTLEKQLDLSGF